MVVIVCILVFIVGYILAKKGIKKGKWMMRNSGQLLEVIGAIFTTMCVVLLFFSYSLIPGELAKHRQTYKGLQYKLTSEKCRDKFGLLNKEIVDEIQEWNEELALNKAYEHNFWIGIFVPNVYDEFEFIEYK